MPDSNYTVTSTTDNFSQFVNNTNTISKNLGATGNLTTTIDSDIVGAINELDSDIGARPHTNLTTVAKTITAQLLQNISFNHSWSTTVATTIATQQLQQQLKHNTCNST